MTLIKTRAILKLETDVKEGTNSINLTIIGANKAFTNLFPKDKFGMTIARNDITVMLFDGKLTSHILSSEEYRKRYIK